MKLFTISVIQFGIKRRPNACVCVCVCVAYKVVNIILVIFTQQNVIH